LAKQRKMPDRFKVWIEARKRYHLSHAQIQMARELGMNPKRFGGKANHRQEPWKVPLPQYIEHLYEKRFGRQRPEVVMSIEDRFKEEIRRRAEARERRRLRKEAEAGGETFSKGGGEAKGEAEPKVQPEPNVKPEEDYIPF